MVSHPEKIQLKHYGLIGNPVSHSRSPELFMRLFKTKGIADSRYFLYPLKKANEIRKLIQAHPNLQGLNVTIPFKQTIIPFLDHIDKVAALAGAVNVITIKRKNREEHPVCCGYNTDVESFKKAVLQVLRPSDRCAMILGSGGAGSAVRLALNELGLETLLVSRHPQKHMMAYGHISKQIIKRYKIIVNATPLGMQACAKECPPIPYHCIGDEHILFDLIYNPEETLFMKKGKASGAYVCNGLKMLEYQVEYTWKIWEQQQMAN